MRGKNTFMESCTGYVLTHEASETLVRAWNANVGAQLNQSPILGLNVDLQLACLVERAVQQSEQALVENVRSRLS